MTLWHPANQVLRLKSEWMAWTTPWPETPPQDTPVYPLPQWILVTPYRAGPHPVFSVGVCFQARHSPI